MGMGRNGKSLMGIPWDGNWLQNWEWEWEGMRIDCTGNGSEWECKKPFPGISNCDLL